MVSSMAQPKWGNWFLRNLEHIDYQGVLELTTSCNYHCAYCSNGRGREEEDVLRRGHTSEDIDKIVSFFNHNKTWHIVIGGGEASINPRFYDLANKLSHNHYISVYTNLSLDIDRLFRSISSERIVTVRCTLHNLEKESDFFNKLRLLKEADFNPAMVLVATPERMPEIDRIAAKCTALEIPFSLFPLAGPYLGKIYPRDYDQDVRDFLLERPSLVLYPGHIVRLLTHKEGLVTSGFMCTAGANFFSIHAETGAINRCEGVHQKIGDIYTGQFSPLSGPTVCPSSSCIDYCYADNLADNYAYNFFNKPLSEAEMLTRCHAFADESIMRLNKTRKITTERAHDLIAERRTLLWGSGMAGSFFLQAYLDTYSGDNIVGFVDTNNEKWGKNINGKKIYAPHQIAEIDPDIVLICAPAFEEEILKIIPKWITPSVQVFGLSKDVTNSSSYAF